MHNTAQPINRSLLWLMIAAGFGLRLAFALLPLSQHLILLEDDAWMVAAIARNVALGRGISADGINPTTGFQPLYPLTLGAIPFLINPNNLEFGFQANLIICAILATLVIWPLFRLTEHLAGAQAGLIAVALYALNPALVRLTVNSMETALGLLLLTTMLLLALRHPPHTWQQVALLSLVSALAILARLDAVLALSAIMLVWGLERLFKPQPSTPNWPQLIGYGIGTVALLTPYFAFNYRITGDFGPSSGRALMFMQSYAGSFNLTNGLSAIFQTNAIWLDWIPWLWLKLLIVVAMALSFWWVIAADIRRAAPLLVYLCIPPLYYGYLLQQIRERYFVGMSLVLIILLAWLLTRLLQRWAPSRQRLGALLACLVVISINSSETWQFSRMMQQTPLLTQPTSYQAALWIRDNLPVGVVIGAKNSGIYQYYSGHTILNIDGKLNHDIVPQLEQRQLLNYLRQQGVQYLVDRESTMADHISFYSQELADAQPHRTPSLGQRITIYAQLLLNRLGVAAAPTLDRQNQMEQRIPFSQIATIIQRFPRPNQAENPVVIYQLK